MHQIHAFSPADCLTACQVLSPGRICIRDCVRLDFIWGMLGTVILLQSSCGLDHWLKPRSSNN